MTKHRTRRAASAAKLRRGRMSDLDALVALEREIFRGKPFAGHVMSRASLRRFLKSRRPTLIVAEVGTRLAGYVLVLYRANSRLARLYSIGTAAHFRRQGLARKLLCAAENEATNRGRHAMRLEVRENDPAAVRLYESSGYHALGKRHHYYDDGVDALRVAKPLHSTRKVA